MLSAGDPAFEPFSLCLRLGHCYNHSMASKQDLKNLDSSQLAAYCKEVSHSPTADATLVEEAWRLRREWFRVVGPPAPLDYKLNDLRLAEERALSDRMADFLNVVL